MSDAPQRVEEFAPGDLCEIVAWPGVDMEVHERLKTLGRRVVLTGLDSTWTAPCQKPYVPFWRAAGLPMGVYAVSWTCLRKIPPAPMDDEDEIPADPAARIPTLTEVWW